MTERSVKRVMLGMTIASVTILTALAVAGLVVTSRGPQAQALPLVRTLIAEADVAGSTGATVPSGPENDQPQHSGPSQLGDTTTTATVVALAEAPEATAATESPRRDSSRSRSSVGGSPDFPPFSLPPTTVDTPRSGITPPSTSTGGHVTPPPTTGATTTVPRATPTTERVEAARDDSDDDHDREVILPSLRISDHDRDED